MATVYS